MIAEIAGNPDEAGEVLRTLIVSLGGFCAGLAFIKAVWRILPFVLPRRFHREAFDRAWFNLFLGILLLSFSGISVLTTDHIYQHLIENDTPLWQLWTALVSFMVGAIALIGLIATRARGDSVR